MSIASMADIRLARTEKANPSAAESPKVRAGIPVGLLNTLSAWVPTETIAMYVAVQAVMPEVVQSEGSPCAWDYSDRWLLFGLGLALSVALVPIYAAIKVQATTTNFRWPVLEMMLCGTAFTLWVMALQDSPFADFTWYDGWVSVAGILGGGGLLGALTVLLKVSPAWTDAAPTNAAPSPYVS